MSFKSIIEKIEEHQKEIDKLKKQLGTDDYPRFCHGCGAKLSGRDCFWCGYGH